MRKKGWKVIRLPHTAYRNHSDKKPTAGEAPGARSAEAPGAGECSGFNHQINAFIKKVPLLGSVIKIQRPSAIPPEKTLDRLAKKHRALFIKIEPSFKIKNLKLNNSRFQRDTWPLLPTKTLHLDLTKSEKELWDTLDSDARYSIRKAKKKLNVESYTLENTKELRKFHQILKNAGKRQGFPTPGWEKLQSLAECFRENGWLITAGAGETSGVGSAETPEVRECADPIDTLAGCILLTHKQTAYYHHAATTTKGRKQLAGYMVLWKALTLTKKLGCTSFDFEGIYDERYHQRTKDWQGFTYFKKKFGGNEITYPRPLIKYYSTPIKILSKIFPS